MQKGAILWKCVNTCVPHCSFSTSLSAQGQDPELCLSTAVNSKDPDSDPRCSEEVSL